MQKWEHRIVVVTFESENDESNEQDDIASAMQELDVLGEEGWEVAGVFSSREKGKGKVIVKRPIAIF